MDLKIDTYAYGGLCFRVCNYFQHPCHVYLGAKSTKPCVNARHPTYNLIGQESNNNANMQKDLAHSTAVFVDT